MVLLGKAIYFLWVMLLTNLLPMRMAPLATGAAYMVLLLGFAAINLFPLWKKGGFTRLGVMLGGEYLLVLGVLSFMLNLVLSIAYGFCLLGKGWGPIPFVIHILFWILFSTILVLNGFFRIFFTSVQWGIRRRVVFLLFWWVPVAGLVLLAGTCRLVRQEYEIETEKQKLNALRRVEETCRTHYPLVLVHGVFFRDRKYFNYWGRIPGELIRNGATVYYGGQQSAASTENAAKELRERILRIVEETGCGKVNIIAHSKGGLEARWAVGKLGLAPYVASLTTINTPHRGCAFADWLLGRLPQGLCHWAAARYNGALRRLGDPHPDFLAAVYDLTAERCAAYNGELPDVPGVLYQSVGSKMKGWTSAPFPLNLAYLYVRRFERENDGLVGVESMKWGERFRMLTASGRRGISHGDMIDLNRQNFRGFDVREFYVELVRDLKERGC